MRMTRWCVAACLLLLPSVPRAQTPDDRVAGAELAAAVNLPQNDVKVSGLLFVPASVKQIRAVIVIMQYGETYLLYYHDDVWRRAAEHLNAAIFYTAVSSIDAAPPLPIPIERQPERNAALGGGDGLVSVLKQLARESGHAELDAAPGGFGPTFAQQHPERALGIVRYHTHQRTLPVDVELLKNTPMLIMAGGKDETAGFEDAESLWRKGQAVRAPWTFVLEPNVPHGLSDGGMQFITNANQLVIPWITAVVQQRLALTGARLLPMNGTSGWSGDNKTGDISPTESYAGAPADKNWLPDGESARGWRSVRQAVNPGRPCSRNY